jgi:hypothetical protein
MISRAIVDLLRRQILPNRYSRFHSRTPPKTLADAVVLGVGYNLVAPPAVQILNMLYHFGVDQPRIRRGRCQQFPIDYRYSLR